MTASFKPDGAPAKASSKEPEEGWIDLPDARIHYRWDGEPGQPVLVLSNALGANLTIWDTQIDAFSKRFRVLRYDTRGHGQSSIPPGPYSIEALGHELLALLDGLGVDTFCFCGLSMGGTIGMWLGTHAPSRVRKLVLCNTAPKIGAFEVWNARIDEVLRNGVEAVSEGTISRWFTLAFRDSHPEIVAKIHAMLNSANRAGYAAACAAVRDADLRESVHSIRIPALIVAGLHDPVAPPQEGKLLTEQIEGAQYVELNAAHLSNVEAAEEFTSAVLRFLE
jgi:3-oxoadipate enol-lactonase